MTADREDTRLTAYILGELSELEIKRLEAELEENEDLAQELKELQETAALLEDAFDDVADEAPEELDSKATNRILDAAAGGEDAPAKADQSEGDKVVALKPKKARSFWPMLSAAAALVVGAGTLFTMAGSEDERAAVSMEAAELPAPASPADVPEEAKQEKSNRRYGVRADKSKSPAPPPPRRRQALKEARQFGMIGQLSAGAGQGKGRDWGGDGKQPGQGLAMDTQLDEPSPGDRYDSVVERGFTQVSRDALSTFSIDVDTASYSLIRKHLKQNRLPPTGAVRIEEMINYFSYDYPQPNDSKPFALHAETAPAPWAKNHLLVKVGIQGKKIQQKERPPSNLVFLVDVSGSMQGPQRLGLLKRALGLVVNQMREQDHVSLVVYAGSSGVVLEPTSGSNKAMILEALQKLEAGGSTHGSAGISKAYALARQHFKQGGINRVILATDGDFNVGLTSNDELTRVIQQQAKSGVFLSVLGFGSGNYNDSLMEKLADKGNGNYAYIDSFNEARKVLFEQASGTLVTIAKDVKIQVQLNPSQVQSFRLIGYENRMLAHRDFNDDTKDAGEIGAGHSVTALYELVLKPNAPKADRVMELRVRYKQPDGNRSDLVTADVVPAGKGFAQASDDFKVAAAAAGLGMELRGSAHRGDLQLSEVESWLRPTLRQDPAGRRAELLELVQSARRLKGGQGPTKACDCRPGDPLCSCD